MARYMVLSHVIFRAMIASCRSIRRSIQSHYAEWSDSSGPERRMILSEGSADEVEMGS